MRCNQRIHRIGQLVSSHHHYTCGSKMLTSTSVVRFSLCERKNELQKEEVSVPVCGLL
jgi:hypothetical protein